MKGLRRIEAFFTKGKLSAFFIIHVAVFALYITINTSAMIFNHYYSYRVLNTSKLNISNTYIYGLYPHEGLIAQGIGAINEMALEDLKIIEESEIVDNIYTIRCTGTFKYMDLYFGIILYDQDIIDTFPMLRKYGVDFQKNPEGVIVSHEIFKDLKIGDRFEMTSIKTGESMPFTCAGHMKYPYKYLSFNGISSDMNANILFDNQTIMIMLADEETISFLKKYTDVDYKTAAIFSIKDDATADQINILLNRLRMNGFVSDMDSVLSRSKEMISEYIKAYMLLPLFLAASSITAYFSITIVNVYKRRREMAVSYLCGAGKRHILSTLLGSCVTISLIPVILAVLYILYIPQFQMAMDENGIVPSRAVISDQIWIVVVFFVLTVIVSFAAALFSMGRKSPLAYLRGLE